MPGLRRAEQVETEESFESIEPKTFLELRSAGLDVWVLVPLSRIAAAHETLRGVVDRIQPWWLEGDRIKFGTPRVP